MQFFELSDDLAFVLIASDGVWEFMSDQEVVDSIWLKRQMHGLTFHEAVDAVALESARAPVMRLPARRGVADGGAAGLCACALACAALRRAAPPCGRSRAGSAKWAENEGIVDDITILALAFMEV